MKPIEVIPHLSLPTKTITVEQWWKENTGHLSADWHRRYAIGLKEALQKQEDVKAN